MGSFSSRFSWERWDHPAGAKDAVTTEEKRKLSENSPGRWHGDSGGSDYSLEPGWCWHEFRCLSAPCAVFVVQLLDPGETFRWESVVLGEKRALILYSGPAGRAVGCDWYRWQSECRGDVAVLVQELPGNNEGNAIYFHAKGAHGALREVWETLSCNPSFSLFGAVLRWTVGDENAEAQRHAFSGEVADEIDGEAEELEPEQGTAEVPNLASAGELTAQQKALVKRMHDNMGHPDKLTFLRTARWARASPAVQKYIKEKFECEACQSRPLPKPSRPATVVRGYRPGVIVGVDVLFLPDVDPRQLKPVLNIVDWGSGVPGTGAHAGEDGERGIPEVLESVGPSLWVPRGDGDGCRDRVRQGVL